MSLTERRAIRPVVVIPLYRWPLEGYEAFSLRIIRSILGKQSRICFIAPDSLDLPNDFVGTKERIVRFGDAFFEGVQGYNRMLLSEWFFRFFAEEFTHMLICQLDCLVFRDELEKHCSKGLSYIGAPWFKHFWEDPSEGIWAVGNGGFSLRDLSAVMAVFRTEVGKGVFTLGEGLVASYVKPDRKANADWKPTGKVSVAEEIGCYPYNEDLFWSFEAPRVCPKYRVASPRQALAFAFENLPRWCYRKNWWCLPFGCHAWQKNDPSFWVSHLIRSGIVAENEIPNSLSPNDFQQSDAPSL